MAGMTTQPDSGVVPHFTQGDRLRKARSLTGLTTRDFAEVLGVSHGTVTNAEGDKVAVRPITLNAWAFATGVSRSWLETGIGALQPAAAGAPPDGYQHGGNATELARWTDRKQRRAPTSHTGAADADKRGYRVAA